MSLIPETKKLKGNICAKQDQSESVQRRGLSNMKMFLFCLLLLCSPYTCNSRFNAQTHPSLTSSAIFFVSAVDHPDTALNQE